MFDTKTSLESYDPELAKAIAQESRRQEEHIELIASENYASPRVMAAQGSVLTNKYAEGYPGKRYYGGCEFVDDSETLAIERAKELFGADYANVQPHSGSQANGAVYMALCEPGDTVLGMSLTAPALRFSPSYYPSVYGISQKIRHKLIAHLTQRRTGNVSGKLSLPHRFLCSSLSVSVGEQCE